MSRLWNQFRHMINGGLGTSNQNHQTEGDLPSHDVDSDLWSTDHRSIDRGDQGDINGLIIQDQPWETCPVCSTLPLEKLLNGLIPSSKGHTLLIESFDRGAVAEYFHKSAEKNCGLCRLIIELGCFWPGEIDTLWIPAREPDGRSSATCNRYFSSLYEARSEFQISCEHDSFLADRINSRVVHKNPLSDLALARMQDWVRNCDATHAACNIRSTRLPTRLLDVRDLQNIVLCDTADKQGTYLTLSHCWGSSQTFLTTRSTIAAMKAGFKVDELPATFRDAVLVTKAFGQRYLWIDSLCIIQGDPEDWAAQSAKMADIYENSYFTIAALDAKDDSKGFLERNFRFTALDITSTTGQSARVYLEIDACPSLRSEPLRNRAWTLQEEYLSRRVLSFGKYEATWKCSCAVTNETGVPDLIHTDTGMTVQDLRPLLQFGHLSCKKWYEMISHFSTRAITHDTDKLPALAGLASRVASLCIAQYCAGLWWGDILCGLLWKKRAYSQTLERPAEYIAPSWSWASVNGPIGSSRQKFPIGLLKLPSVSFDAYHLEAATSNAYGQLREGSWLKLRGPLMLLDVSAKNHDKFKLARRLGCIQLSHTFSAEKNLDFPDEPRGQVFALVLSYNISSNYHAKNIIQEGLSTDSAAKKPMQLNGLLVRKTGRSSDSYERVGSFGIVDPLQVLKNQPVVSITLY